MKANIYLADTPYTFDVRSAKGITKRSAQSKYNLMTWGELAGLRDTILDAGDTKECVMFLWSSSPVLHLHMDLLSKWGFGYKGYLVWGKTTNDGSRIRMSTGYTFRNSNEILLYGTRLGTKTPKCISHSEPNTILAPRNKHSAKPNVFHDSIKRAFGDDLNYVELFARDEYPGWHCYGDEISGNDIRVDLQVFINQ